MALVYRLESLNKSCEYPKVGIGIYNTNYEHPKMGWIDPIRRLTCDYDIERHPTPDEDGEIARVGGEHYHFGFKDLHQMFDWFDLIFDCGDMKDQIQISVYECQDVRYGNKQVIFDALKCELVQTIRLDTIKDSFYDGYIKSIQEVA